MAGGGKSGLSNAEQNSELLEAFAADPHMEERKRTGVKTILFLLVLTAMLYAVKRKVWADVH